MRSDTYLHQSKRAELIHLTDKAIDELTAIAAMLDKERIALNLSWQKVAALAGVDKMKLHHAKHGRQVLSHEDLAAVCDVLNID